MLAVLRTAFEILRELVALALLVTFVAAVAALWIGVNNGIIR